MRAPPPGVRRGAERRGGRATARKPGRGGLCHRGAGRRGRALSGGLRVGSGRSDGGHRRRRRPASHPGGGRGGQEGVAGQQGGAGDVRRAVHGGGAAQWRRAAADRQRAQCDLPVHARRLRARPECRRRTPDPAHRLRWPVPRDPRRGAAGRHPGTGLRAPQLVHGAQDFRGFGQHDEQGPGADRGLLVVRCRTGQGRGGGAPAERDPLPGGLCRRFGAGAAG
ncbi:hypothetical protein D3C81_1280110 [compost metagenome]